MTILAPYTTELSRELSQFLAHTRPYPMYGMMQYFMGFADESLEPHETYGGKRFRSALTLLIADAYGAKDLALPAALSVELFHNFTLIHDDIIDNDEMRRGRPTIWKLWGVPHAINTGDGQLLLVQQALGTGIALHPERGLRAQQFLIDKYLEVIEGQYLDFMLTDMSLVDAQITREAYFEMITKKTSVLVGAATNVGGIMAGLSETECNALYDYGFHLGMAVQLHDDLMSIWGDEAVTGKKAHGDIKERKKTLPVIFARDTLPENDRAVLCRAYGEKTIMQDREARALVSLLDSVHALAHIEEEIEHHIALSRTACERLSLSDDSKQKLRALYNECMPR